METLSPRKKIIGSHRPIEFEIHFGAKGGRERLSEMGFKTDGVRLRGAVSNRGKQQSGRCLVKKEPHYNPQRNGGGLLGILGEVEEGVDRRSIHQPGQEGIAGKCEFPQKLWAVP